MSSPLVKAVALFIDGTTNAKHGLVEAGAKIDALTMAGWTNVAILSEWIPDSEPQETPSAAEERAVAYLSTGRYFSNV